MCKPLSFAWDWGLMTRGQTDDILTGLSRCFATQSLRWVCNALKIRAWLDLVLLTWLITIGNLHQPGTRRKLATTVRTAVVKWSRQHLNATRLQDQKRAAKHPRTVQGMIDECLSSPSGISGLSWANTHLNGRWHSYRVTGICIGASWASKPSYSDMSSIEIFGNRIIFSKSRHFLK
jgi:hypothetical protein